LFPKDIIAYAIENIVCKLGMGWRREGLIISKVNKETDLKKKFKNL
jgi:hypothetical protein